MKMYLGAATAVAAALVATSAPAAVNLISNGSFEQTTTVGAPAGGRVPVGFTIVNNESSNASTNTVPVVIAYGQASAYPTGAFGESINPDTFGPSSMNSDIVGGNALYFSSDGATLETVGQNQITLQAGQTYAFGFDYYLPANGQVNPNDAVLSGQFTVGGQSFQMLTVTASQRAAQTWYQALAIATTPITVTGQAALTFRSNGFPAKDFVVDRLFLTAVPEPASWAMMVGGFGLMGAALRRRKSTTLFA